ncbi:hypothetical protein [Vallitalea guaymasensis]|uniref:hypothetical protein n=1 Tax=Vallitalea guaymasensis TaxID=1185412 RepID=UPI000DE30AA6|nr:hypothetical protein [Vallitalea guaymasensis]
MENKLSIDSTKNKESFNYVNCFEKPLGLILGNHDEKIKNNFFLLLKLMQSYNIECFDDASIFYTIEYNEALAYIFEDMLNIQMNIQKTHRANLNNVIKNNIDNGRFALVPGNLKVYPGSEYYEEYDWKHLILVNGYNDEEKIYYVCDNTHEEGNDGSQYIHGTIDYELLEKLFESAVDSFDISSVWSLNIEENAGSYSEKEMLMNVLDLYLYNRSEQPYMEIELMNTVQDKIQAGERIKTNCEGEEILKSMEFILLRTIRYKEFFYQEMVTKLRTLDFDENMVNKIENVSLKITEFWMKIANSVLINYHLMQKFDMDDQIIRVMAKEKEMFRLLDRVKGELDS